ncbi:hypothetical protein QZH41_012948 [Actinostola sp. cb2023]|nr:hypothetical protein QZH41_012948 [Actinostola sp. cb2023]
MFDVSLYFSVFSIEQDPPPPGIFSKAKLKLNMNRLKAAFGLAALSKYKRATHCFGCGAVGKVQVVAHPEFPEQEFFTPGRVFPVRLRHANLRFEDDAASDFRSASLKFADSDDDTLFDVTMATGCMSIFQSTQSVWDPLKSATGIITFKEYLLLNPIYLHTNIDGIRRAPISYTDQVYYSQTPFNFKAKDGKNRYVKYRLINAEGRPETGLLTEEEQRKVWERERYPEEKRPKDYLKKEYEERLDKGPVHYKLQLQLHEISTSDSPHILNSSKAWDDETHPWMGLADVTITTMLADDVIERTKYNTANKPSSLGLIGPPESIHDFKCISYYRKHVYKRSQRMRLLKSPHQEDDNVCTYVIQIETGDVKHAGTDATITLSMTGSKGRTDAIVLNKHLHNFFARGEMNEYKIKTKDIGDVYVIHFHNERGGTRLKNPDWFLNKVTILKEGCDTPYEFPCYSWVLKELVAFHGAGLLPHQEQPEIVRIERQLQIQERKKEYKWAGGEDKVPHFPGYINAKEHDDIPKNSQFSDPSMKSFHTGRINAGINLGISYLMNLVENWDSFGDFKKLYTSKKTIWCMYRAGSSMTNLNTQKMIIGWKTVFFGMQHLNGTNPMMIERCNKLPERFPVTQALVGNLLDRGVTLEEEIKAGHIYIVDYSLLEHIPRNGHGTDKVRYVTEPLVLLYVNSKGDLVPIAIQLFQNPSDKNPIWTPNDNKLDWIFVKMWAKAADLQIHQMVTHLLRTHLIMECFAVAAWRELPSVHPVFKLLYPHIRSVMAINTIGRKELISKGGISDVTLSIGGGGHLEIIQKFYKEFAWDIVNIPANLEKRGLLDREKLPNFYYRDDALTLWKEITTFLSDIVGLYYHSDTDVVKDVELQAWVKDVHDNGFTPTQGHVDHQFPNSLESRDQLINLLTCVIFTCSCQHAAVNFGQLDVYAFIPNAPPTMQLPPPTKKGETTMKIIMNTLPTKWQTGWHIGTMHTLTRFAEDEKFLGDYSDGLFVDPKAMEMISKFQEQLQNVSDSIKSRNKSLEWPYIYLLPERVPNSVAI